MPVPNAPARLYDLQPGTDFQGYILLEQIGIGGQGVVWSGLDPKQKRILAIKFNEIPETDQGQIDDQMVVRQASILVGLEHAHVLPILDIGTSGTLRYFLTPYLAGGSLQAKLSAHPIPLEEALRYIAEVCSALDYLHGREIIHRDLKPSNVLMDLSDHSYLADFGLARVISASTQALHTGRGTPLYAPPEQHALKQITPQSDLYSLGIMLYELFTHQLPWKGEQVLGVQQLYSQVELPDPREVDPGLPEALAPLLRRITSADPMHRPASAHEILAQVTAVFGLEPVAIQPVRVNAAQEQAGRDAMLLLDQAFLEWQKSPRKMPLSLTRFAIVDQHLKDDPARPITGRLQSFMLQAAMTYGYNDQEWWQRTGDINDRLAAAMNLIEQDNPAAGKRVLQALARDPQRGAGSPELIRKAVRSLISLAGSTAVPMLQMQALASLRQISAANTGWRQIALDAELDAKLADLARPDTEQGDEAARLIGHLRSEGAVRSVLDQADPARLPDLLLAVQGVAGSLPACVPMDVRLRTTLDWILVRLALSPWVTLKVFAMTFLGVLLGFGMQVYLTYRLPEYMDLTRFVISLERGAFMGAAFGSGILLTRLLVERLQRLPVGKRLALAVPVGGLVLLTSLLLYNLLFLKNITLSPGVLLGPPLIALGFAASSLLNRPVLRVLVSLAALVAALAGSWWLHVATSDWAAFTAPLLYYEYDWSPLRVWGTMLLVSLPMAILGNYQGLNPREK